MTDIRRYLKEQEKILKTYFNDEGAFSVSFPAREKSRFVRS